MTRAFDNPNHKFYGPIRRLWVVMVQLDLLTHADNHRPGYESAWEIELSNSLKLGVSEHLAQRHILAKLLLRMGVQN